MPLGVVKKSELGELLEIGERPDSSWKKLSSLILRSRAENV